MRAKASYPAARYRATAARLSGRTSSRMAFAPRRRAARSDAASRRVHGDRIQARRAAVAPEQHQGAAEQHATALSHDQRAARAREVEPKCATREPVAGEAALLECEQGLELARVRGPDADCSGGLGARHRPGSCHTPRRSHASVAPPSAGPMSRLVIVVEKASDWGSYFPSENVIAAMDYLKQPIPA